MFLRVRLGKLNHLQAARRWILLLDLLLHLGSHTSADSADAARPNARTRSSN
jgi:hypothetical protein